MPNPKPGKITRRDLNERVVSLANLSPSTESEGYFSRIQLFELILLLEKYNQGAVCKSCKKLIDE